MAAKTEGKFVITCDSEGCANEQVYTFSEEGCVDYYWWNNLFSDAPKHFEYWIMETIEEGWQLKPFENKTYKTYCPECK